MFHALMLLSCRFCYNEAMKNIFMLLVPVIMVAASELLGEKEIIFPEVAALCTGCFLAPRLVWHTNYLKMIAGISICAVLGVLIVLYAPFPLWIQFAIGFMLGQLVMFFLKTSFAPMISAVALPILIQTKSEVYIIAAFCLTLLVILLSLALEKLKVKEKTIYEPLYLNAGDFFKGFAFRSACVSAISILALNLDVKFCMAPPLLVAFTELTNKNSPASRRFFAVIILVTLSALAGTVSRYFITVTLGLPLALSAFAAGIMVLGLVKAFSFPFPPVAAMSILAMLIPQDSLASYPIQVFAGITLLSLIALVYRKVLCGKIC